MDAKRDWGHAKDYVEMQWLMLQQDEPDDFAIATGEQHSVRDFVNAAANELGITLRWEGTGVDEKGIVAQVSGKSSIKEGDVIVQVDSRYFRPTEVTTLLGDASKAEQLLGWKPLITFKDLVIEMMQSDLEEAQRDDLLKKEGYNVFSYNE